MLVDRSNLTPGAGPGTVRGRRALGGGDLITMAGQACRRDGRDIAGTMGRSEARGFSGAFPMILVPRRPPPPREELSGLEKIGYG